MAGNSKRQGAIRRSGTKKGMTTGSGGQRRKALQGKGPTPRAEDRPGHPAQRRKGRRERESGPGGNRRGSSAHTVAGRNAVLEALQSPLPATALWLLDTIEADDRVRTATALANKRGIAITTGTRKELDGFAHGTHHQGVVLQVPEFGYADLDQVVSGAGAGDVLVLLDHITDPHNLGAIARSALAFGARGMLVPQRRSAPVTSTAWKTSAGALARLPVVQVGNVAQTLQKLAESGWFVLGLDGSADTDIGAIPSALLDGPLVLAVGAEGDGLARLTRQRCDLLLSIPTPGPVESLNASVAAGVALYALTAAGRRRPSVEPT